MTRGYFSSLSTIFVLHFIALMVTIEFSRPEMKEKLVGLKLNLSSDFEKTLSPRVKSIPLKPRKIVQKSLEVPSSVEKASVKTSNALESVDTSTSGANNANALEIYKSELRAMIDKNKYYPVIGTRLGQTGTVVVAFTLLEDGNIIDVRIDRPSRFDRLNSSALDAVKKVERFKPLPKEFGGPKMDVKVPVTFVTI